MPVIIPKGLPANDLLQEENIFVMNDQRASHQDIRPLEILILNLMPTKIETECQLLRLLSNTPLQINITFLKTDSYRSKNISESHLETFYKKFSEVKDDRFDGLIITGAPVEHLQFETVTYWDELVEIMEFSKKHVTSTLHICWGAQAGLYHHFGVHKRPLKEKLSGVYPHKVQIRNNPLLRGFDDEFMMPHSRYTESILEEVYDQDLNVLVFSEEAGGSIISTKDCKQVFVSGHLEYTKETLSYEYIRDVEKGIQPEVPKNYFKDDNPSRGIEMLWRGHAHLLFSNWMNYCVYQQTPYKL